MKTVLKWLPWLAAVGIVAAGLFAFSAYAGAIKTWNTNDTLRSTDLNANFDHIHNRMVGGHGARLIDSDVNASAAISHTKLKQPGLIPKAMAAIVACDGAAAGGTACAGAFNGTNVASIQANGAAGVYRVNLSFNPPNTGYMAMVTCFNATSCYCTTDTYSTTTAVFPGAPHFYVRCWDGAVPAAINNVGFIVTVYDNDNWN